MYLLKFNAVYGSKFLKIKIGLFCVFFFYLTIATVFVITVTLYFTI